MLPIEQENTNRKERRMVFNLAGFEIDIFKKKLNYISFYLADINARHLIFVGWGRNIGWSIDLFWVTLTK
jgi:hypothetical protein